mmetsp:Transcript_36299/g.90653  ORF Transcript_36299/g.90653 Transcript_36299/m.90653 type:complete len:81 (+) Transcript_36299:1771-2013(+)
MVALSVLFPPYSLPPLVAFDSLPPTHTRRYLTYPHTPPHTHTPVSFSLSNFDLTGPQSVPSLSSPWLAALTLLAVCLSIP